MKSAPRFTQDQKEKEVHMSSLAMRRARERYLSKERFPLGGSSDHGYKAGNVVIWVAGIGLLMILMF